MNLKEIHKECHKVFKKAFFEVSEEEENNEVRFIGPSNACKVFDKLTEDDYTSQDCIGENFNQLIHQINDE